MGIDLSFSYGTKETAEFRVYLGSDSFHCSIAFAQQFEYLLLTL